MKEGVEQPPSDSSSRLTREDVMRLAGIQGLPIAESDLDEVRYRLNALVEALDRLASEDLAGVDPLPLISPGQEA